MGNRKLKVGDKVKLSSSGINRYPSYIRGKIYIVEPCEYAHEAGDPVVYSSPRKDGWVNESMGLQKCFELVSDIYLGGE